MIKSNMPNIPGMGAMTDSLEFVKNLWGSMGLSGMSMPGMNLPGMVMPTLSIDEINKKITDLKAVESWLGLNMNMLRTTIQALEVQAATITTLQSMGESFTATMNAGAKSVNQGDTTSPSSNGSSGADVSNGSHAHEKLHGAPEPTSKDESDAANLTAPIVNAAAWWNMLQDQFKQAVNSAMTAEPVAASSAVPTEKSKAKPKAKAVSSTASTTSTPSGTTRKRKPAK